MKMSKLMDLLTICRKAGQLELGFDPMKEALSSGKAQAVITASDLSPKTEKEVRFFAGKNGVPAVSSEITLDEAYRGFGKKAGIFTVCGKGFAEKALEILKSSETSDNNNNSD